MKIQSKAVFYANETISDGIVIFTGDGATYGDVLGVSVSRVIDFTDVTNISTGQDADENFLMILELTAKKVEINLAKVTNQPTWENDADGLQVAIHDVLSWKKKSSVGYELPDPATAEVGQVVGAVDGAYAFVDPPAPTNPKVYRALLNQTDTNPPVATEMPNNTLIGITYGYNAPGDFKIISDAKFKTNKTFIKLTPGSGDGNTVVLNYILISESEIECFAYGTSDGSYVDSNMINASIEILVFD